MAARVRRRLERRERPRAPARVALGMSAPGQAVTLPSPRKTGARGLERLRGVRLGPHHLALAGVLALSAIVNTHRLSQNGYGNIFYSAGVKSMLRSWHNFFF